MTTMDRRNFLTQAVFSSAAIVGATALGGLDPESALAQSKAGSIDPNFAEGRITGMTGGVLSVLGSNRILHVIHVTGATSVWKLRPTTSRDIAVGDGLYARGVRLPDGALAADAIWLNLVNLDVDIVGIARDRLALRHGPSPVVGYLVAGTSAVSYKSAPASSDLSRLRIGHHVRVVGAWRPDTNAVDVATIHSSAQ